MVEIFKGKKGGEYILTRSGKKCYLSLIKANYKKYYDIRMNEIEKNEDERTIPVGLLETSGVEDWNQVESRIESSEIFISIANNTKLNEQEQLILEYLYEGLSRRKIAQIMHLSPKQITQIKDRMARKLWIHATPDEEPLHEHNDENISLHRFLEKLPPGSENDAEIFRRDRRKDIEMYGAESVYNLIPFGFPARKTVLITDTFNICRETLGDQEFTRNTLLEIEPYDLRDVPGIKEKSVELMLKLRLIVLLEDVRKKRDSSTPPKRQ